MQTVSSVFGSCLRYSPAASQHWPCLAMDPLTSTLTPTRGPAAWPDLRPASAPRACPSIAGLCLTWLLPWGLILTMTCWLGSQPDHGPAPSPSAWWSGLCVDPGSHPQACPAPSQRAEGQSLAGKVLVLPAQGPPLLLAPWSWGSSQLVLLSDDILSPPPGFDPRSYTARGFSVLILQAVYSVIVLPEEGGTFSHSNKRNFPYSLSASFPP